MILKFLFIILLYDTQALKVSKRQKKIIIAVSASCFIIGCVYFYKYKYMASQESVNFLNKFLIISDSTQELLTNGSKKQVFAEFAKKYQAAFNSKKQNAIKKSFYDGNLTAIVNYYLKEDNLKLSVTNKIPFNSVIVCINNQSKLEKQLKLLQLFDCLFFYNINMDYESQETGLNKHIEGFHRGVNLPNNMRDFLKKTTYAKIGQIVFAKVEPIN